MERRGRGDSHPLGDEDRLDATQILFALDNYDHGSGGAEKAAQSLARALAGRGRLVRLVQSGPVDESYADGPLQVHTLGLPDPGWIRDRDALH